MLGSAADAGDGPPLLSTCPRQTFPPRTGELPSLWLRGQDRQGGTTPAIRRVCSRCRENEVREGHSVQQYKSRRKVEWKVANAWWIAPVGGGRGAEEGLTRLRMPHAGKTENTGEWQEANGGSQDGRPESPASGPSPCARTEALCELAGLFCQSQKGFTPSSLNPLTENLSLETCLPSVQKRLISVSNLFPITSIPGRSLAG